MAVVFGEAERDFYSALFMPDTKKRQRALSNWIISTTPIIQAKVVEELKMFIETVMENGWTVDWLKREERLRRIQNDYHLVMDISLRRIRAKEKIIGISPDPIITASVIDLHGMTVTEALKVTNEFITESYKAHEHRVWIIHGKGTGVLRQQVRKCLERHRLVKCFTTADKNHGGEGATEVEIVD